jgi:1,2-diacylglycerol 3-alpha-glucosyltransferase
MVITLICDTYGVHSNGTTVSAARFVQELRRRGHEVRVVGVTPEGEDFYPVHEIHIPLFQPLVRNQGITLGRAEPEVLRRALDGADVVHIYLPFPLGQKAEALAREMGVARVGAFHMQPENITYNIGLRDRGSAGFVYFLLRKWLYGKVDHIHCPSAFIANEMQRHGYKSQLHVITNGIAPAFTPGPATPIPEYQNKILIAMVGRLSPEKRQDVLIRAVGLSKYADRIQLLLAGKGPKEKRYRKLGQALPHPPVFGYYTQAELVNLFRQCTLYVHASDVETEAISCMEAFACGLVPVIADSSKSATRQFARDGRSLFEAGNPQALADKIDYWIEHPEERKRMGVVYADYARQFSVESSVTRMEEVYRQAMADEKRHPARERGRRQQVKNPTQGRLLRLPEDMASLDYNSSYVNKTWLFRLGTWLFYYAVAVPILGLYGRVWLGLRIKGRRNLAGHKGSAITVANHVHMMDAPLMSQAMFPRRPFVTAQQDNLERPVIGTLVRCLGGVPIPENPRGMMTFLGQLSQELKHGRLVHFYPEGILRPYDTRLMEFKGGAFHLAVDNNVPVIPMVFTYRPPNRFYRLFGRKKPLFNLTVLPPIYPDNNLPRRHRMQDMKERAYEAMQDVIDQSQGRNRLQSQEPPASLQI